MEHEILASVSTRAREPGPGPSSALPPGHLMSLKGPRKTAGVRSAEARVPCRGSATLQMRVESASCRHISVHEGVTWSRAQQLPNLARAEGPRETMITIGASPTSPFPPHTMQFNMPAAGSGMVGTRVPASHNGGNLSSWRVTRRPVSGLNPPWARRPKRRRQYQSRHPPGPQQENEGGIIACAPSPLHAR